MVPDKYKELLNTVEKYVTTGSCNDDWRLDAIEEDGLPDRLNGYPFATTKDVGVHLSYKKGDFTVTTDVSSNTKATWRDIRPNVLWKKSIQSHQHEFFLCTGMGPLFAYTFSHPQFIATFETQPLDKLSSNFTVSTRLSSRNQLGLSAAYDPSRSGLKDYTVAFSRIGCSAVQKGDFLLKYNATHGGAVHIRIPLKPQVSALALVERERLVLGAEARSPCGTQVMMNVNLLDARTMLTVVRNVSDIFKVTINCSASLLEGSSVSPRFGVVFSSKNLS